MLFTIGLCLAVLGEDVLPGSNLSLQQAKAEARIIVVAEVVKVEGIIGLGAVSIVTGVELKPSTVLKGKVSRDELKDLHASAQGNERTPNKGEEFVFFIIEYEEKGNFHIIKVLPKTEETLKELKAP